MTEAITALAAVGTLVAFGEGMRRLGLRHALPRAQLAPVTLVRIANPEVFAPIAEGERGTPIETAKRAMRELFRAAFANPEHADPEAVLEILAERAADPLIAVFATRRGQRWTGLAIASGYLDPFNPHPWVQHFYAPGDRDSRVTLSSAIAGWARGLGATAVVGLNRTGKSDRRWAAAHRRVATGFRPVATYGVFAIGKE